MFLQRSESRQQRDYLLLGRHALHYYDHGDRHVTMPYALGRVRDDVQVGLLLALIPAVAIDISLCAGITTGVLTAGGHFNSLLLLTGMVNAGMAAAVQRYCQYDRTLRDLARDAATGKDSLIRRQIDRLQKKFGTQPVRSLPERLRQLFRPQNDNAIPTLTTRNITDDGMAPAETPAPTTPTGGPETPPPVGSNESPARMPVQFFTIARRLAANVDHIRHRFDYPAEQALDFAHRFTQAELMLQPKIAWRSLVSRVSPRQSPAIEFGLLSVATDLYRQTLTQPEHPDFATVLTYFEQRNAQPA